MAITERPVLSAAIGTEHVRERAAIKVENPATGERIGSVPDHGPSEVEAIVARARAAQPIWEQMGFQGRAKVLLRAQKWLIENADRVIDSIVSETGKAHEDAQVPEIAYTAAALGFWAKAAPKYVGDQKVRTRSMLVKGRKLITRYRPLGVVGVIGPWNYPLLNSFGDCIPALAAGNATVLKPSEITPLTSLLMAEMMSECGMPMDAFQVVTGAGETGAALVEAADGIMFTGSTATGKKVAARAAESLTPVSLELGGKDPMIVLADADVERAANGAVFFAMHNGGQACISVERVYVEEAIYEPFVEKVTEKVRALRQGPPAGAGSIEVGAVIWPPQLDKIESHVKDAVGRGAEIIVGGKVVAASGRFFEPTVLVGVDHTAKIMREETFGPTLPIMKVRDADEAVRLANDSPYGLAASVWTRDTKRGQAIARRIEAGAVCVNDAMMNYLALEMPMGGHKGSGLGHRHGAGGIRKFTKPQAVLVQRFSLKRDLYWYPFSPRTTRLLANALHFLYGRGRRK